MGEPVYSIGSDHVPGLSKLIEECGEVQQVAGKIIGAGGMVKHWDGSDLAQRLTEEMADVVAVIEYFVDSNPQISQFALQTRIREKHRLFHQWAKEQPPLPESDQA